MFGKLKDKLKKSLSVFSKKAEEEAEEKQVEQAVEEKLPQEGLEESQISQKAPSAEDLIEESKEEAEKEEETAEKAEEKKEEPKEKEEVSAEELIEEVKEEAVEEAKEEKEEKVSEEKITGVKITYFVHGTTTDNEQCLCTGHAPGELSELGITQAKELPEQVKDKSFEVIFTSDLKRAVDSAELGFKGYKIIQDKRLRECDYGNLTQEKEDQVDYFKHIEEPFPKGESMKHVEKRIADFLNHLFDNYQGKHIAILAHKAPQLALDVLLKNKTWEQAIKEDWRNKKAWQPGWVYELKGRIVLEEKEEKPVAEQPTPETAPPKKEKTSFFKKIKQTITTKTISENKFNNLFWDLELILLENNVSVEVIEKIKQDLKTELVDKPLPRDVLKKIQQTLTQTLTEILSTEPVNLLARIRQKETKPYIIAFFGINGSGKTTSIAKLSHFFQKHGLKTVLAASDTFRAAAIQQLEEHANKLNTKLIKHDYGSDAAAVAFDAVKYAQKNNIDVVLIDTAGRLHSNINLMEELKKITRVTNPDFKIFVGESFTGNDCIEQAKKFQEAVDIDAAILTKADVDEKGGAPLSIAYTIKKPILYLGVGQEYSDLEEFKVETILGRLGF